MAFFASHAAFTKANIVFLATWLAFIAGDVYTFATGRHHEEVHKKAS